MKPTLTLTAIAALTCLACAGHEGRTHERTTPERVQEKPILIDHIAAWPETSQKAAYEMVVKYGDPAEMTDTQLVWHEHGPWKRAVLSREGVPHDWPKPHVDVLEQVIDFKVDPDRYDELARFDGSVMVERTKGELSARCGGEPANFLAINLAQEVATGKRSVEDARAFYEDTMSEAAQSPDKPTYMTALIFEQPQDTADPDRPALAIKEPARIERKPAEERSVKRASDAAK